MPKIIGFGMILYKETGNIFDKERMVQMTKDPVCEMPLEEEEANSETEYNGQKYYFCSIGCKEEFESNPEKYLKNIDLGPEREIDHSA